MPPRQAGPADPDAYAALEEQRDFLLASLDDLEAEWEAGDLDPDDYRTLKDDYTARAAAVIRALEEGGDRYRSVRRPTSLRVGAAVVASLLVFGVGAGVLVARSAGTRTTGQEATGDIRLATREQLSRALQLQAQGDVVEALEIYDEVLAGDPENVEALTYRGWALVQVGGAVPELADEGIEYLERALAVDAGYPDARVFLAIAYRNQGRTEEARAQLEALDDDEIPVFMQGQLDALRQELDAAGEGPAPPTTAG